MNRDAEPIVPEPPYGMKDFNKITGNPDDKATVMQERAGILSPLPRRLSTGARLLTKNHARQARAYRRSRGMFVPMVPGFD